MRSTNGFARLWTSHNRYEGAISASAASPATHATDGRIAANPPGGRMRLSLGAFEARLGEPPVELSTLLDRLLDRDLAESQRVTDRP
jgi:hypothetical protein